MSNGIAPQEGATGRRARFPWGWGLLALVGVAGIGFLLASGGLRGSPDSHPTPPPPAPPPPVTDSQPMVTITPLDPPPAPRRRPPSDGSQPTGETVRPGESETGATSELPEKPPGSAGTSEPEPQERPAGRDLQAALRAIDRRFAPRIAEARRAADAAWQEKERRIARARLALEEASDETRAAAEATYEQARAGAAALDRRSRERWEGLQEAARRRIEAARADYEEAREEGRRGRARRERYERVRREEERVIEDAEKRLQRELDEHRRLLDEAERRFRAQQEAAEAGSRRAAELRATVAEDAEVERAAARKRALEAERDRKRAEARRAAQSSGARAVQNP